MCPMQTGMLRGGIMIGMPGKGEFLLISLKGGTPQTFIKSYTSLEPALAS